MVNRIMAIDPGSTESGYVMLDTTVFPGKLLRFGKVLNKEIVELITNFTFDISANMHLLIEMPASYGMAVGRTVFDTCTAVGFFEAVFDYETRPSMGLRDGDVVQANSQRSRIYRKRSNEDGVPSVSMQICKNNRANDSNVRAALIDLYPATGGGSCPQKGTKNKPGPLYGVAKDVWAALAVAITYQIWLRDNPVGIQEKTTL